MVTNDELASAIAAKLGYVEQSTFIQRTRTWRPMVMGRLLKGERLPGIESSPALVRISGKTWFVDLYSWQDIGKLTGNTVGITGNPRDVKQTMDLVLDVLPEDIREAYERKERWLIENPMYQRSAVRSSETKAKVSPSQLIV